MLFGHLALAGIAHDTLCKDKNFYFLALAAFGPDLIDKPLTFAFGLQGRGVGHTLLIFFCLLTAAWLFCRVRRIPRSFLIAGASLWLSHLAADFIDSRVAYWPVNGPLPEQIKLEFWERIDHWLHFYHSWHWSNPQFCLEFLCILLALLLWGQRRLITLRLSRQSN